MWVTKSKNSIICDKELWRFLSLICNDFITEHYRHGDREFFCGDMLTILSNEDIIRVLVSLFKYLFTPCEAHNKYDDNYNKCTMFKLRENMLDELLYVKLNRTFKLISTLQLYLTDYFSNIHGENYINDIWNLEKNIESRYNKLLEILNEEFILDCTYEDYDSPKLTDTISKRKPFYYVFSELQMLITYYPMDRLDYIKKRIASRRILRWIVKICIPNELHEYLWRPGGPIMRRDVKELHIGE